MIAYYIVVSVLLIVALYAFNLLILLGIPLVIFGYWLMYKIGDRFGWWKQGWQ